MTERPSPDAEQLRCYCRRALSPEELLALSDRFVRHPEQRPPYPGRTGCFNGTGLPRSKVINTRVEYAELVGKLDGITDSDDEVILSAKFGNDQLSAECLADLAAFIET